MYVPLFFVATREKGSRHLQMAVVSSKGISTEVNICENNRRKDDIS